MLIDKVKQTDLSGLTAIGVDAAPHAVALSTHRGGKIERAPSVARKGSVAVQRIRGEILREAIYDGFLGVHDGDVEGLVQFVRDLRSFSPGLAVQLLKPLLQHDAIPQSHKQTGPAQAIFVFGNDAIDRMQQQSLDAAAEGVADVGAIDVQAGPVDNKD